MSLRKLGAGFIAVMVAIFIIQNLATVETGFLWWSFRAPRAVLLFVTFAAGVLVGLLLGRFPNARRSFGR